MSIRSRVADVLAGRPVSRPPFLCRMDFWHRGLTWQAALPPACRNLTLDEIHRSLGLGRQDWLPPLAHRYRQVELVMRRGTDLVRHEHEPEIAFFPDLWGLVPVDQPGEVTTELITPAGTLTCRHAITEHTLCSGTTRPQMTLHPVREPGDFRVYQFMLEHAELVTRFDGFLARERELGDNAWLVPMLNRTPFQSLLIDALGEIGMFYALHDNPRGIAGLMEVIDARLVEALEALAGLPVPYVEFCENLDGVMTNPNLFREHAIPFYRRYAGILHAQGKRLGAHTDGNLGPLVDLLPGSGLDVCESFTPAPLTDCPFEDAWNAWQDGPLIWGGIPSHYLEPRVPEDELHRRIDELLTLIGDRPIILGITDAVMSDNDTARLKWVAARIAGL